MAELIKLSIEPYWVNAAQWWLANKNSNNQQFKMWLYEQGVSKMEPGYLYFKDSKHSLMFQLKWG